MPHINYRRGESREFVVRKDNWSTGKKWQRTLKKERRKGLAKRAFLAGFGARNWCPCCQYMNPNSDEAHRRINHVARAEDMRIIREEEFDMMYL